MDICTIQYSLRIFSLRILYGSYNTWVAHVETSYKECELLSILNLLHGEVMGTLITFVYTLNHRDVRRITILTELDRTLI